MMFMREIKVKTNKRQEMVDITNEIEKIVEDEKLENGLVTIYAPHTTAAVTINEGADPDVQRDIIKHMEKIVPERGGYKHMEGNSDAHIKSSIIGPSETIIVSNGKLVLGTWQHIFFFEGDGPRTRKVDVEIFEKK